MKQNLKKRGTDPFTIRAEGLAASSNPLRFSTKFTEDESDFLYCDFRYYNPNTGKWLNGDPIAEPGFESLRRPAGRQPFAGANLYLYVANNPVSRIDPVGLKIHYCTVPTSSFPTLGIGTHAYLWDDRSGLSDAARECGQESSCGTESKGNASGNTGPGGSKPIADGTVCVEVLGSAGNEAAIMTNCQAHANTGIWFPGINDCHNKVQRCLKRNNVTAPANPRFRPDPTPAQPGDFGNYDKITGMAYPL